MAPSRGVRFLGQRILSLSHTKRTISSFIRAATNPEARTQIYISHSLDPYINLSIEHYLLQKSPADSTILFLYRNRPCIVIGRNQNPWVEVNLPLLRASKQKQIGGSDVEGVALVRRRSGGGTVFHDEGNVNYSVIVPPAIFDRDKHAEMVVRALKRLGVNRAMVNVRHDIVLAPEKTEGPFLPLKVSGSAYKLTRLRSLHHGTCLLSSPNIGEISQFLQSPAKPFIKGRGVESVSSPISNVNVSVDDFQQAVVDEFQELYHNAEEPITVGEREAEVPEVAKGLKELMSLDWIYLQTPRFSFSTSSTEDDPRERPPLPDTLPSNFHCNFTAQHGQITEISLSEDSSTSALSNMKLHEIDWEALCQRNSFTSSQSKAISAWLDSLLGVPTS
ncbi:hypothetical protein F5884DRAFT_105618 [Xylogone sp. PMI_703]|nr:hypothetical protein F5884DRAFT_105618 [Xylogone sp. PMI_703]